jgi:uncharacterized membrane protein
MIKNFLILIMLGMALVGLSLAHEARADSAFGGTSSTASWGAANGNWDSSSASGTFGGGSSGGGNPGHEGGNCGHKACKVPEPSSLILLAGGLAGVVVLRRTMRRR